MLTPASSFFRQDPFADFQRLARGIGRTSPGGFTGAWGRAPAFPAVNVWRSSVAVAVTAELPGVELEDIDITVKDRSLTLSGERKAPGAPGDARWHLRERSFGRFSRSVDLPFAVDPEQVEARFRDGVLHVVLHRPEEDKPRRIEIKTD